MDAVDNAPGAAVRLAVLVKQVPLAQEMALGPDGSGSPGQVALRRVGLGRMDRQDRADQREKPDMIEPTLAADAIENTEANEPTEPIDRIEPADPMDRIDPAEPIDRIDPVDPMDRIEPADPAERTEPVASGPADEPACTLHDFPMDSILAVPPRRRGGRRRGC